MESKPKPGSQKQSFFSLFKKALKRIEELNKSDSLHVAMDLMKMMLNNEIIALCESSNVIYILLKNGVVVALTEYSISVMTSYESFICYA